MPTRRPPSTSAGRSSRSSGRAVTTRSSATSRVHAATFSIRSRRRGSAQWTSSKTSTSGRRRAVASTRRRTAQKVSSGVPGSPIPRSAAAPSETLSPSGSSSSKSPRSVVSTASSLASSSMDAAARTAAATGANVAPPAGSHRTSTIRARRTAAWDSSRARRDLPTPGEPTIETSCGWRSAMVRSSSRVSRSSSLARPTNGDTPTVSPPASNDSRRNAGTGSDLPFTVSGSRGRSWAPERTRRNVDSPTSVSPGPAACCRRAATFTASPTTSASLAGTTTSPVLMPTRTRTSTGSPSAGPPPSAATASWSDSAAASARIASSSRTSGTPKAAITPSPVNFTTRPPCSSIAARRFA